MTKATFQKPVRLLTILLALTSCLGSKVCATTFTISNTNDSGAGSLRQAILDANADGTATAGTPHILDATGATGTITMLGNLDIVANHITLTGPASLGLILDGANTFNLFRITAGGSLTVSIENLIIQNGLANSGGGIFNEEDLNLLQCWIRGNSATGSGGGIHVTASTGSSVSMIDCIVSGNSASSDGGGIALFGQGAVIATNCVIAGNNAGSRGGGIYQDAAMFRPRGMPNGIYANTIIALNTATANGPNISDINASFVTTLGGNLIGDNSGIFNEFTSAGQPNGNGDYVGTSAEMIDPDFVLNAPVAPNIGGNFQLRQGSLAIDTGVDGNVLSSTDLNDRPRIYGASVDIGAFEFDSTLFRLGNVNAGLGPITDVLFVNGSAGTGFDREVEINRNDSLTLSMAVPPSLLSAPFVAYAFAGNSVPSNERALPAGIGTFCMPNPITDPGAPALSAPLEIWNNVGFTSSLGLATRPSSAAPTDFVVLNNGTGRAIKIFVQALIRDDASLHGQFAITNGIFILVP